MLILGNEEKTFKQFKQFIKKNHQHTSIQFATYEDVFDKNLPDIEQEICIFPFFPETFWDEEIEGYFYYGVYGNHDFYIRFLKFWEKINTKIHEKYFTKKVTFINPPYNIPICRDKIRLKNTLIRNKIPTPDIIHTRDYKQILSLLEQGTKLFVKVRCGSMGKGITYLEKDNWKSNFDFDGVEIKNKHSDHDWNFQDYTNDLDFLQELLKADIIVEEAVEPKLWNGMKFDIRYIIWNGKILHKYARVNSVKNITTNVSQGAERLDFDILAKEIKLTKPKIRQLDKLAINTAEVLGLNFAGVDIILNDDNIPYVLEANAFPGFPNMVCEKLWNEIKKEE